MRLAWSKFNATSIQSKHAFCNNAMQMSKRSHSACFRISYPMRWNTTTATVTMPTLPHDTAITSESISEIDSRRGLQDHRPSRQANSKPHVLASFYRSLATQDMDKIWPQYSEVYHHNAIQHLTRRNFRQLFLCTIRSKASQKNLNRLLTLVDDMKAQGMQLRHSECNALMHWIGGRTVPSQRPHHLSEALALFEDMQQQAQGKKGLAPSIVTFNTLMHVASKAFDIRLMQRLYHDMIARGIQPDVYTFSILLSSLGQTGDIGGMENMLQQLESMPHISGNIVIWNTVMSSYALNGQADKAKSMFDRMYAELRRQKRKGRRRRKLKDGACGTPAADAQTFRIAVESRLREDRVDDALELLSDMSRFGLQPSVGMYNAMFAWHMKSDADLNDSQEANKDGQGAARLRQLYAAMNEAQIKPNSNTLYTLVSAFLDQDDVKSALETYVQLSKEKVDHSPPPHQHRESIAALAKSRLGLDPNAPGKLLPRADLLERLHAILIKLGP